MKIKAIKLAVLSASFASASAQALLIASEADGGVLADEIGGSGVTIDNSTDTAHDIMEGIMTYLNYHYDIFNDFPDG